jgi:divalent metal cation (Fe/Co/Zn/Cd) transporter
LSEQRQLDGNDTIQGKEQMQDEIRALIESFDRSRANEARTLYWKARNAAAELRVIYGAEESLREADEIDALADHLREVFEAQEQVTISLADQ